ncbi:MAG: S46 family peptidase, partial [Alistipes sp.]|nr:S46 family peptidase [Alistipes sp.]
MKKILTFLVFALAASSVYADEGMWLPSQIAGQVADMRAKGFELTAGDLYSTEGDALNSAIVLFGGGCTGAIVSAQGLLFTNHHCGYGQIQKHSSVEHDYLTNGFWAMNRGEELPNPGLEVRIMRRMEEVTEAVAAGRREELIAEASEGGRYK